MATVKLNCRKKRRTRAMIDVPFGTLFLGLLAGSRVPALVSNNVLPGELSYVRNSEEPERSVAVATVSWIKRVYVEISRTGAR